MYFRTLVLPLALAFSTPIYAQQTSSIPFKTEPSASSMFGWPLSLSILIIILGLLMYWNTRRQQTCSNPSQLVLLTQKRISAKTWSSVIQVEEQRFLLVDNGHCIKIQPLSLKSHEE